MSNADAILKELERCYYRVSTDTRLDLNGSIYFALKGENHDGNLFVQDALKKGAKAVVTDKKENAGENVFVVDSTLKTLQEVARKYREQFSIPIIVIGGSNGKTTSKDLISSVLETKYKIHRTKENLNNEIGLPLSLLNMGKKSEIGVFEVGANHAGEHLELMKILSPTIVVVTNNGLDHLEGFGSPEGVRKANKEIYDWALKNKVLAFVDKEQKDLVEDSERLERILYPEHKLEITNSAPLSIKFENKEYVTNLAGDYNLANIGLALSVGKHLNVNPDTALKAVCQLIPSPNRSQLVTKNGVRFVVDCYNANPSSMEASLSSFLKSTKGQKGVILGDMLELGKYSAEEHKKIVKHVSEQKLDCIVFVGPEFKKALENESLKHLWFPDSLKTKEWFIGEKFNEFTFLLKGSRGIKIERILGQ